MYYYAQVDKNLNDTCIATVSGTVPITTAPDNIQIISITKQEYEQGHCLGKTYKNEQWTGKSAAEKNAEILALEQAKTNLSHVDLSKDELTPHEQTLILKKMCQYLKTQGID